MQPFFIGILFLPIQTSLLKFSFIVAFKRYQKDSEITFLMQDFSYCSFCWPPTNAVLFMPESTTLETLFVQYCFQNEAISSTFLF